MDSATAKIIEVDGSILEGGGQILRIAISLAAILNKPVRITRIRAGRSKPGLSNQHLSGLQLATKLTGGSLSGGTLGSTEVTFIPRSITCGTFHADAHTAGSVSLMLQVAMPILLFAQDDSELELAGGTDAQFAPPIDYMSLIAAHYFKLLGIFYRVNIVKRGYYPQGGGLVKVGVTAVEPPLLPVTLTDLGSPVKISGYAFVAGRVPIRLAHEMRQEGIRLFRQRYNCPMEIEAFRENDNRSVGNVSTFMFIIETSTGCRLAASRIGNPRGPHHNELVAEVVKELNELVDCGACCDNHMQDQLILPMALASGQSQLRTGPLTLHTKTAIFVTELLLSVKFELDELANGACVISCTGVGHCAV